MLINKTVKFKAPKRMRMVFTCPDMYFDVNAIDDWYFEEEEETPVVGGYWSETIGEFMDAAVTGTIKVLRTPQGECQYSGIVYVEKITTYKDEFDILPEVDGFPAGTGVCELEGVDWNFPGDWLCTVSDVNKLGNFPKKKRR
jgi:hypothetical protein